ncbi:hypothetical protein D3C81_2279010 [compost metagenome]
MLLERAYELRHIGNNFLSRFHSGKLGISRIVRNIAPIVLNIDDHGIEFGIVHQLHQCI